MYNIDELTLLSGIDIPIIELQVNIHQPTIGEIAYIGERSFYRASSLLILNKDEISEKDNMNEEDKAYLSSQSNFQVLMSIINQDKVQRMNLQILLTLLFPSYAVDIEDRFIMMSSSSGTGIVNEDNFEILQNVVKTIFCLGTNGSGQEEFNPAGERARLIAEKIKRGRAKVAALKGQSDEENKSTLSRYVSGLSIGTNSLDIKKILDLTLYQLFDQLERYGLYVANNLAIKAKMAGAKDVEDIDWLKSIH